MNTHFPLKHATLLIALSAVYPLQAHALAGVAQFTAGEVNLRQTDGRTTALTKGGDIDSGHAIVTGPNGRAQVKFTDGGLVSLQPNTEFKIASYVDQNDPKQDRFLVDLLRGSMRAITGLIGKRNRDNYKLTTTTATIGIRGSGFKVGYNPDGSLGITSELDKIEVCNLSGCIGLVAGESVKVVDSATPPVRTSEQPKTDTPAAPKDSNASGEKVKETGKAEVVEEVKPVTTKTVETKKVEEVKTETKVVEPVKRTFTDVRVAAVGTNGSTAYNITSNSGATTQFSDNKLLMTEDASGGFGKWYESGTVQAEANFKSSGNVSDANFIGWGMWTSGTREYLGTTLLSNVHYVAGRPTAQTEMNTLMLAGGSATYSLIGSTPPTRGSGTGTLNSATFSVSFTSTSFTVSSAVNTSYGNFTDSATGNTPNFAGTYIRGLFIGTNAAFAGMTYNKDFGSGPVAGALAFKK
ncbi:FecR family protein [Polaromonas sp.]|uniref:FecR family protein n=1 Tax=Polaromonas sp. TaxID=1869339 RepID=UPI002730C5F3|nr:FecR family protein [Polaromonas sp.]MDP1741487.1 FecR family protein [Polaromonas sp.]